MKKHIITAVFSLVAAGTVAQAGQEGHGGRVYFCKNSGNSDSAELLDYYLGRTRWGMDVQTQTGQNEIEIVTKTLESLKKIDPSRAAVYLARSRNFMNRASMGDESDFKDTDDVQTVLGSRKDCDLKLVIRQNIGLNPFIPEEKKFLINQDRWAVLDTVQRAGLILHEIILEDSHSGQYFCGWCNVCACPHHLKKDRRHGQRSISRRTHANGISGRLSR